MNLTPIETSYKGYRFRSRLEARWAVFFDKLNIGWEYEPEGFHLEHVNYLPDFKLHGLTHFFWLKPELERPEELRSKGVWFEVKPLLKELDDYETRKIEEFSSAMFPRNELLYVAKGDPLDCCAATVNLKLVALHESDEHPVGNMFCPSNSLWYLSNSFPSILTCLTEIYPCSPFAEFAVEARAWRFGKW